MNDRVCANHGQDARLPLEVAVTPGTDVISGSCSGFVLGIKECIRVANMEDED